MPTTTQRAERYGRTVTGQMVERRSVVPEGGGGRGFGVSQ